MDGFEAADMKAQTNTTFKGNQLERLTSVGRDSLLQPGVWKQQEGGDTDGFETLETRLA